VRPSPQVYARPFGDEVVLLDFALGEYFGLDAVGACIWKGLERGRTLPDIAASIAEQYEVTNERALADVLVLVESLRKSSLVEIATP
jgi:hypothetical protein